MKAVHFGAGNIGRGLIAQIYDASKIEITFIDTNKELVEQLNTEKKYNIVEIDTQKQQTISNFQTFLASDQEAVLQALIEADVISTSVGSNNLKYLKPIFKKLAEKCLANKTIICFENGFRISDQFKKELNLENRWNFINASTDRIVPLTESKNLDVLVESFYEIVLEKKPNIVLPIKNVDYTNNLDIYILRKLFAVNALHSGIAYLGYKLKFQYIHQAMEAREVQNYIKAMQILISKILISETNIFLESDLQIYFQKIIKRFQNSFLKDSVTRVARNPLTKIAKGERYDLILTKANALKMTKTEKAIIYETFANILSFDYNQDEQATLMQALVKKDLSEFLKNYTNINSTDGIEIQKLFHNKN